MHLKSTLLPGPMASLVLVLALVSGPQPASPVPVYAVVTEPRSFVRQISLDLLTGYHRALVNTSGTPGIGGVGSNSELTTTSPQTACSLSSSGDRALVWGRLVLVNLQAAPCGWLQQVERLQAAGASGVLFWDETKDVSLPRLPVDSGVHANVTIPTFGMMLADGTALSYALSAAVTAQRTVQLTLPLREPSKCRREHAATITSARTDGDLVVLRGTFPGQSSSCWFYDPTRPGGQHSCLQFGASATACGAITASFVYVNETALVCRYPRDLPAGGRGVRVAVQTTFVSGSVISATCFSHQHTAHTVAAPGAYAVLPAAALPSQLGSPPPDALHGCACDVAQGCTPLVPGSRDLWCVVAGTRACPPALPFASGTGAARPCLSEVPGLESSPCLPGCQGRACSTLDACVCDDGYTGGTCTRAVCEKGCVAETGACVAPDVCDCVDGWTGISCNRPVCEGDCGGGDVGTCVRPGQCVCHLSGTNGATCADAEEVAAPPSRGDRDVIIVLSCLCCVLLLGVCFVASLKKGGSSVTLQSAPEGAELGPLVSRVVTTSRAFLWCAHTTEREEDVFRNNSEDYHARRRGLLPSYRESQSSSSLAANAVAQLRRLFAGNDQPALPDEGPAGAQRPNSAVPAGRSLPAGPSVMVDGRAPPSRPRDDPDNISSRSAPPEYSSPATHRRSIDSGTPALVQLRCARYGCSVRSGAGIMLLAWSCLPYLWVLACNCAGQTARPEGVSSAGTGGAARPLHVTATSLSSSALMVPPASRRHHRHQRDFDGGHLQIPPRPPSLDQGVLFDARPARRDSNDRRRRSRLRGSRRVSPAPPTELPAMAAASLSRRSAADHPPPPLQLPVMNVVRPASR